MTVNELIQELHKLDPQLPVLLMEEAGDVGPVYFTIGSVELAHGERSDAEDKPGYHWHVDDRKPIAVIHIVSDF